MKETSMSTNGNGNGTGLHSEAPPTSLEEQLVTFGETLKAIVEQNAETAVALKAMREDAATRDGRIMVELGELHSKADQTKALAEYTAVRVARIDNERELSIDEFRRVRREVRAASVQIADLDKREAVNTATTNERIVAIDQRDRAQDERLEKTGSMVIDAKTKAEAAALARVSQVDIEAQVRADVRTELREEKHDTRETKRSVLLWALGIIGFLIATTYSGYVGSHYFHAPIPTPSIPGATQGH